MDYIDSFKKVNKIIKTQEDKIQELEKKVETLQETTKLILDNKGDKVGKKKYGAVQIANSIAKLTHDDMNDNFNDLTLSKLMRLLYIFQGFYKAINNKPLFDEDIIAERGFPIVREVYNVYSLLKLKENDTIFPAIKLGFVADREDAMFIKSMFKDFKNTNNFTLESWLDEKDSPYRKVYLDNKNKNKIIPVSDISKFCKNNFKFYY